MSEIGTYFADIVLLLKRNGITTIGADSHLTERNIMKLTDLLKEQPSPDENNLIDILKDRLERMEDPQYRGGLEGCEKSNHFLEEIREIIGNKGADVVIETTGSSQVIEQAYKLTSADGKTIMK